MLKFRYLRADEVDARVSMVKANGCSLLLYKDARCDMNILDETVGPMNWQRHHTRDNANCILSIWDDDKKQWIEKEDTGTESYTEKEKGLASDSFKRAAFNFGIGRELYAAPFIWIPSDKCTISQKGTGYTCYDRFSVKSMKVENGKITHVTIFNNSRKCECYSFGMNRHTPDQTEEAENQKMINEAGAQKIDNVKWRALCDIANKKKISQQSIISSYGLKSPSEMTVFQWKECCDRLNAM